MRARLLFFASLAIACGGNVADGTARSGPGGGGPGTGGASTGGVGGAATGGASTGGVSVVGAGGVLVGGFPGAGGGVNCANVGCGAPPICTEGCQAPCGCCPCAEGEVQAIGGSKYVCSGGCFVEVAHPVDAGAAGCSYGNQTYADGQSFRAGDGCNTCMCTSGQVGCTKKACTCDPASEMHQRDYNFGTDYAGCQVIRENWQAGGYACPPNTTFFLNACGCGCEQGIGCPDWFDCQPAPGSTPCDTTSIKTTCPYSGIAF